MKITTKQRILSYIRSHGLTSGSELESQAQEWYTKPSVISRRARELAADGYLERSTGNKGAVQYRAKASEKLLEAQGKYIRPWGES